MTDTPNSTGGPGGPMGEVASSRLDRTIRESLALEGSTDVHSIAWGQTAEWDSVAHMQLVAGLESEFGVMIDTDDVIAMSDYAEICRILSESYGVELAT